MWRIIEILVPCLLVLIFFAEFLIPLLKGKQTFSSFRKTKVETKTEPEVKKEDNTENTNN
jgi:hypothetical protein